MKTRKSLAFILALVMMLTLIPASAFAVTNNTVTATPTVAANTVMPVVTINVEFADAEGLPAGKAPKFKIDLENATWNDDNVAPNAARRAILDSIDNSTAGGATSDAAIGITSIAAVATTPGTGAAISLITSGESSGEVVLTTYTTGTSFAKKDSLVLHLNLKSGSTPGEVKVKINGLDSSISSGTYTVATVAGGNTVATVSETVKKTGRNTSGFTAAAIEIRETAVNSVSGGQQIILSLPKGCTFVTLGGLTAPNGDMVMGNVTLGALGSTAAYAGIAGAVTDDRDVLVRFQSNGDNTKREVLVLRPIIAVDRTVKAGPIDVQLRTLPAGNTKHISEATSLTIAEYAEEGVTVSTVAEKDLPQIYAGRQFKSGVVTPYYVEVTLEETQNMGLAVGRVVDFDFPKGVYVVSAQAIQVKSNVTGLGGTTYINAKAADKLDPLVGKADGSTDSLEWEVPNGVNDGKASKVSFKIPVTVDATFTGDLKLKVSGAKAGVTETEIVVGKVVAPVTATTELKDVRTGVQKQAIGNITIKESFAGAIRDEAGLKDLKISIKDLDQGIKINKATAEVKAGDFEIKKTDITNGVVTLTIDRHSIKTPAEILLKDVEVTLNRTPAEGKYQVRVGGDAIVDNDKYDKGDASSYVTSVDYVNVATPAEQGVNSAFVIGNKTYTVNGVTKEMDAAPYIDSASRTMVPIRYIGYALGLTDYQVLWNPATATATLFGKSTVVITVGKDTLSVNGAIVPMDTKAVNKDGRIYVPARYIGNALGAKVEWDQATNTVAIYTVK